MSPAENLRWLRQNLLWPLPPGELDDKARATLDELEAQFRRMASLMLRDGVRLHWLRRRVRTLRWGRRP